jgi:hypothetical protein
VVCAANYRVRVWLVATDVYRINKVIPKQGVVVENKAVVFFWSRFNELLLAVIYKQNTGSSINLPLRLPMAFWCQLNPRILTIMSVSAF